MPRRLSHRLLLAVGVPLALAAIAALVVFGGLRASIQAQTELSRVDRIVEAVSDLHLHFLDAQNGARGFVLSGDETFLAPYERAVAARPDTVAELERLLAGDAPQLARLKDANEVYERWLREIAQPVIAASRAAPPQHVAAANDARAGLIELGAALARARVAGAAGAGELAAAFGRFRDSAQVAVMTTSKSNLMEAWRDVVAATDRLPGLAAGARSPAAVQQVANDLATVTATASNLSLQAQRVTTRPVVDGTANRLAERMRSLDGEMLKDARAQLASAAARAERIRRLAVGVAAASLALAITLGLIVALALARRLLVPIRSISRASEAIEAGDLSARAIALTDDEVGRLALRFNGMADRLERRDREISSLHDLSQLLQTAGDAQEAFEIFERLTPVLLPEASGTIHVISPSRIELELRARFGSDPGTSAPLASPDDCWGLRKGQSHFVANVERKIVCAHLGGRDGLRDPYACLPLVSQNETLGLLHVSFPQSALDPGSIVDRREELEAIANALGLALGNLALREKLKAQSVRDGLTGLYNRRFLEEALPREIERCRRRELPLVVVMADLDHFKRLNDTWGHEAGDLAIQRFAETLRRSFRQEDILCRYGGEEFCLVLPECPIEDARRRCEQVLAQMRAATIQLGRELVGPVTASLGLVAFPADAATSDTLLRAADTALYRAKQGGRDRLVRFQAKTEAA